MDNATQDRRIHSPGPGQPQANPQRQARPQSGGGFPWGKIAAGCGCLSLFLMCAAGAAAYFVLSAGSQWAEEVGLTEIVEMVEEADPSGAATSGSDKEGKEAAKVEQEARERKEDALEPEKIRAYLDEPLTTSDVGDHFAFMDEWKDSETYDNWETQFEKMKELDEQDDDSIAGGLKAVGQGAKWVRAARDVMEAFDERVRDDGGYEEYYGRLMRVGGVVAASQALAKSNDELDDPDSDAVAERMLEERAEIAEQYEENFAEAKEAMAEVEERKAAGEEPRPDDMAALSGLATIMQGPGTIALARMPEASFQSWKKLSVDERKRLRETLNDSIAPGSYFGLFSVNPAALVMSAYVAEMEELKAAQ